MRASTPVTPAATSAGANFPNFIEARAAVLRTSQQPQARVSAVPQPGAIALDGCIRPLTSLSREEVAEYARNAADNCLPLREANGFEPGTWQHQEFIRAWAHRQRELVEDAA